ncbi:MAG: thioredoxin-like domain-containing protein [Chitinophagales bacterium]
MLNRYSAIHLLVAASLLFACKDSGKNRFHVNLSYTNADKLAEANPGFPGATAAWVYLEQIVYGKDQAHAIVDSAKLNGSTGHVELTGKATAEGIYELVFGENALALPLINDVQDIRIQADLSKRNDFYTVSGSEASKQLQDLISSVGRKNNEIEKSFAMLDSLKKANASDSLLLAATAVKNTTILQLNDYLKGFMQSTANSTLGFLALSWASRSFSPTELDTAMKSLKIKFPNNPLLAEMEKNSQAQQQAADQSSGASWVGRSVPELSLPDVNGKLISVNSFKGKYLLIDFWASWCGPCRMENPNVVEAYNQFKGKNFTILGVSLDKDKDSWKKAIAQDHLSWTHISDLKYWNSQAVETFGFQGIPFNVLVDPTGKVIAQELRGKDLENKLKEVLN